MASLIETESMDSLAFVKDSTPSREPSMSQIAAPSIDDVSENPEELRALRGQGRYFGISEADGGFMESEPKCNNCSQRGHLKRNCPHVICSYCGSMDDHYSQHCPKAIVCSNCQEKGHYKSQCPKKWKRVYCTLCNSKLHQRNRCPSVWRVYLLKDVKKNEKKTLAMHLIFCYNCGLKGHFGDDCNKRRSSRVPLDDGSAFSGDNMCDELKTEYFQNLNDFKRESRMYSDDTNDSFDYNDYEYENEVYDNASNSRGKNNNKPKPIKRKYSNFNPPPYQDVRRKKKSKYDDNRKSRKNDDNSTKRPRYNDENKNSIGNKNNNSNRHSHPLDFPRNNRNNDSNSKISFEMDKTRYGKTQRNKSKDSRSHNYKSHNSFRFKK